jgi:hypothetical protein
VLDRLFISFLEFYFSFFVCFFDCLFFCRGKGSDITDGSASAYSHYDLNSVTNCVSTSATIKFHLSASDVMADCLLMDSCPTDEMYVSSDGTDYPLCGGFTFGCQSLV